MECKDVPRPSRFDVARDGDDFVVRHDAPIDGQVVIGIVDQSTDRVFGPTEQHIIIMVPLMSGFIVHWFGENRAAQYPLEIRP